MTLLFVGTLVFSFTYMKEDTLAYIKNEKRIINHSELISLMSDEQISALKTSVNKSDSALFAKKDGDLERYLDNISDEKYEKAINSLHLKDSEKYISGFSLFSEKIPFWIFVIITLLLTIFSVTKNLSLIPLLGLISCLYMMSELGISNWIGFGIWLLVGLLIYFLYSKKNSKLNFVKP
jgi:hypothetical protein